MIYQDNEDDWPVDRSGTTIFVLDAIKRLCIAIDANWTGSRSLYPYTGAQWDRRLATEADRVRAVELLSWHDPDVRVERISLPLNDSIPSSIVQDSSNIDLTDDHWSRISELAVLIRSQTPQDVSAIINALEKFAGEAAKPDGFKTSLRCVQTNQLQHLRPMDWNVSRQVLRARYALGRMNPAKLNVADPCGTHHIFVDALGFRTWLSTLSGASNLARAELYIDSLAKAHPTGRPPGNKPAVIKHLVDVIGLKKAGAEDVWRGKAPNHWTTSGAPSAKSTH